MEAKRIFRNKHSLYLTKTPISAGAFPTRGQQHQNELSLRSLLPGGHRSHPNLSGQFTAPSDHQHLKTNLLWHPPVVQSISSPPASRSAGFQEKKAVCEITEVAGAPGAVIESLEIVHAIMSSERVFNVISQDRRAMEI